MTEEARALTRELLRHQKHIHQAVSAEMITDAMIDRSTIPYGVLCERAGVPFLTRGVGRFLVEVAEWRAENG